jgi:energy-coupling factor transport system substrate-specific component
MLFPGAVPAEPRRIVISTVLWAVLSGAYGMAFGALTAIPWLVRGGWKTAVAYTVSGLPFDVTHMIANFCLALVLATPLTLLLSRLSDLLTGKKKAET